MLNFLKKGIEYNNLAKAMNGMNVMIQDMLPKLQRSSNKSEFRDDLMVLAYIARKGVFDRIEEFNWKKSSRMIVPTIERGNITLDYALLQTVGKVAMIAAEIGMSQEVAEIMEKGDLFFEIESEIPESIKKTI